MWIIGTCWSSSARNAHVVRAYYYSAVLETEEYSPLKPLTDWLAYNGYTLVTKPAKEFTDSTGRRRVKGNMDIELAIDMLELADKIDHAVLFSGDSDFRRLVEAVQRRGVRVSVVSSIRTTPPMVADELRRQADQFLELADIAPEFTRRQMEPRTAARAAAAHPGRTVRRRRRDRSEPCRHLDGDAGDRGTAARLRACARVWPLTGRPTAAPIRTGSTRRCRASGRWMRACWWSAWRPGVRGANRTGRPFTGDHAGLLLYHTLLRLGLAEGDYLADPDDGLALMDTRIVNAVRCVPPANLPEPAEVAACNQFLPANSRACPTCARCWPWACWPMRRSCGPAAFPPSRIRFRHGAVHDAARRAAAGRQLPCQPLQHEHRPADRADVPRRSAGPGRAGWTRLNRSVPPARDRRCCGSRCAPRT